MQFIYYNIAEEKKLLAILFTFEFLGLRMLILIA